ncbi:hypothetical protein JYQ62_31885 [Nostoc sp. UHCC 0702]|nr:hypothetical protein JYQ62_31885 [Nostoc sp. UHCC 0702]
MADGRTTTITEAKDVYKELQNSWVTKYGKLEAAKAAIADAKGWYMGWFAQKLALYPGTDLVVMGHTHTAISGLKNALIQYVNSGFECPSKPDISTHHSTFIEIDTVNCKAKVLEVINQNGNYKIQPNQASQDSVVGLQSEDFSCYVIVDNTSGTTELTRSNFSAKHGYYVVEPPTSIPPGKKGRFWIQDYPGTVGTEGEVTYTTPTGSKFNLTYACPTLSSNKCAGTDFYTSNDGVNWGKLNQIVDSGIGRNHPFFVKFSLPDPIPKPPFLNTEYQYEPVIANSGNDWAKAVFDCPAWTLNPIEGGIFNSADQCVDSVNPPSTKGLLTVLVAGPSTDVNCVSYICVGGPGAGEVDVAIYPESILGGSKYLGWNGSRFVEGPAINSNGYYWYRLVVQWKKPYADPNAVFYAKSYRHQGSGAKPFKIWAYKNAF